MNAQPLPLPLPPTVGDRHLSMRITRPGGLSPVRVWLLPDADLAVDAVELVEQLDITEPSTFDQHPVTWLHQWTPPPLRAFTTTYLWSRTVAVAASTLAGDPAVGAAFAGWLEEQYSDLCARDWEGTLDALLQPALRSRDGREVSLQEAAHQIVERYGGHLTRDQVRDRLQAMGWIKPTPGHGAGWRPTHLAIAQEYVIARRRTLPAGGGTYEQSFLTGKGFDALVDDLRPNIAAPLFEGSGS